MTAIAEATRSPATGARGLGAAVSRRALLGFALALFAIVVVAPPAWMLFEVVRDGESLTFAHLRGVLSDARQWGLLVSTLELGAAGAAAAFAIGMPAGLLVARADVPLRSVLSSLLVGPLLLPPLVHAIAWTGILPLRGFAAAVGIFALAYFPVVALFTARAAERSDRRREEAARLIGGRAAQMRLVGRVALPGALAGAIAVFVFVISDFSVPDYLSSVGPKLNVYADEIFTRWQREGLAGPAMASALPPALIAIAGLLALSRFHRRGASATASGDFVAPEPLALGAARWPAVAFVVAILGIGVVAPLAHFVSVVGSIDVLRQSLAQARNDVIQSLLVATLAALSAAALAFAVAYVARRGRAATGRTLDALALLPLALPAIALSIALIRIWNRDGVGDWIYGTSAVVVLVLVARFFALAYLASSTGLAAISPAVEEAAVLARAPFPRTLVSILGRMAAPSIASAFTLVFIFAMRELDALVLIPSGNRTVMFRVYNAIHFNRPQFVAALCLVSVFLTCLPLVLYRLLLGRRMDVTA